MKYYNKNIYMPIVSPNQSGFQTSITPNIHQVHSFGNSGLNTDTLITNKLATNSPESSLTLFTKISHTDHSVSSGFVADLKSSIGRWFPFNKV